MYQNDKGQCNEINNLLCHHSNIPQGRIFGLERPIPSLNNLLADYQEIVHQKLRCQMELEHEMHIAKDLQREVDYYDSMLQLEEKYDKLQRQILKLSNVEVAHTEAKNSVKSLEEQLADQQEKARVALETEKELDKEIALLEAKEFQQQLEELETKYAVEMMEVRENIDEKAAKIKTALKKAELEHFTRKEELRIKLVNRMKSDSLHIECRSIELDLKQHISYLEKELKQLQQQRSKRKLPLVFTEDKSVMKKDVVQHPNSPKPNKVARPPVKRKVLAGHGATHRNAGVKSKQFSVNSDFLDF